MNFYLIIFPLCLIAALLLYYLLPKRVQWLFLLALSLGFYALGGWRPMVCLICLAAVTYGAGLLLSRLRAQEEALEQDRVRGRRVLRLARQKRLVLAGCLVLCLGLLLLLKYWNFAAGLLRRVGLPDLSLSSLLVPLGLSFYSLQVMGYVIDCYRGTCRAQRNPLRYLLFVSFFPQMIQGPISRYDQLGAQLEQGHAFDPENLRSGLLLVLAGCMKKLLIADRAAVAVRTVFDAPEQYGGLFYVLAVLLFCIQIYCDFSGGMDAVRGIARMFGVELIENVRRPIFARSLAEFWRRWHISLGAWMGDYVLAPLSKTALLRRLGRTQKKDGGADSPLTKALGILAVFLLIGLWYGANFRFLFFGLYHGVLLAGSLLLAGPFARLRKACGAERRPRLLAVFRMLRTMALVFVGRYFIRASRLMLGVRMVLKSLLHPCLYQLGDGTFETLGLAGIDYWIIGIGVVLLLLVEWRQEKGLRVRETLARQHGLLQWLAVFLPLALLLWSTLFGGVPAQSVLVFQAF